MVSTPNDVNVIRCTIRLNSFLGSHFARLPPSAICPLFLTAGMSHHQWRTGSASDLCLLIPVMSSSCILLMTENVSFYIDIDSLEFVLVCNIKQKWKGRAAHPQLNTHRQTSQVMLCLGLQADVGVQLLAMSQLAYSVMNNWFIVSLHRWGNGSESWHDTACCVRNWSWYFFELLSYKNELHNISSRVGSWKSIPIRNQKVRDRNRKE